MAAVDARLGGEGGQALKRGMELEGGSFKKAPAPGDEQGIAAEHAVAAEIGDMAVGMPRDSQNFVASTGVGLYGVTIFDRVRDPGYGFAGRPVDGDREAARERLHPADMIAVVVGAEDTRGGQARSFEGRDDGIGVARIDDRHKTGFRAGDEPDIVVPKGADCDDVVHFGKCEGKVLGESTVKSLSERIDRLRTWFGGSLGESLEALEAHRLREILPALAGTFAVQVGWLGRRDLLESSPTAVHVLVDADPVPGPAQWVQSCGEALPFDSKSVQVVLLPHALDLSAAPHQVLREAHRILVPEGHIVILGFNPVSLWRLPCLWRRARAPWCGDWIGIRRLKDWLSLLEFELTQGSMLYYRPPLKRQRWMDRLFFLERMGDRWWPLGAAVYVLVARKRVAGMTPVLPSIRRSRLRSISQPAGARYG